MLTYYVNNVRWRVIMPKLVEACVLGLREDLNKLQFRGCVITLCKYGIIRVRAPFRADGLQLRQAPRERDVTYLS